jgi:hypothetical protein
MRCLGMLACVLFAACVGSIEDVEDVDASGEPSTDDPQDPSPSDPPQDLPGSITYRASIAPKLAFCMGCHGPTKPDGMYRVDSYQGLLGTGKDAIPNVIAGDAASLLVEYLAPPPGKNHKNANTAVPDIGVLVRDWVVTSNAIE